MNKYFIPLEFNQIMAQIENYIISKNTAISFAKEAKMLSASQILLSMDEIIAVKPLVHDKVIFFDSDYNIESIIKLVASNFTLKQEEVVLVREEIKLAHTLKNKFSYLISLGYDIKVLAPYFSALFSCKQIKDKIDNLLDENNNFKPTASPQYAKICAEIELINNKINQQYKNIIKQYQTFLIDQNIYFKEGKKCLLVDIQYKNQLEGNIVDLSNSGKGYFFEPKEIARVNQELFFALANQKKEETRLLKNITQLIKRDLTYFITNQENYTKLDLIYAKGVFAYEHDCNKVSLNEEQRITIVKARHPLIARQKVVPIDFNLACDKYIYLLTGANTGGKTVAIKTVGLLMLMLKHGLPLPCDESSSFHLFERVFIQIGNQQSIKNELSTFSAHISEIAEIIKNITPRDLVILDEPASGTDPLEGAALAVSLITYLINHRIKTLISSHYQQVKQLACANSKITYASVLFNDKTMQPEYRLQEGIIGASNGLITAKRYGLVQAIIDDAYQIFNNIRPALDKEIEALNKQAKDLKLKAEAIKRQQAALTKAHKDFTFERERIISEYDQAYQMQIAKLNEETTALQNELKAHLKTNAPIVNKRILNQSLSANLVFNYELKEGDAVRIIPYQQVGVIKEIRKNKYLVNFLTFTMEFTKDELRPTNAKPSFKHHKQPKATTSQFSAAMLELDLRGRRYVEVAELVDAYISNLLVHNLAQGKIIVGYGSGSVRKAVNEYLAHSQYISKYHLAGEKNGQMGAIIVYLK